MSTAIPNLRPDEPWRCSRRLLAFILVSVALHALALWLAPGLDDGIGSYGPPRPLAVYLSGSEGRARKTIADNHARERRRPKRKPSPTVPAKARPRTGRSHPVQSQSARASSPHATRRTPRPPASTADPLDDTAPPPSPESPASRRTPADGPAYRESGEAGAAVSAGRAPDVPAVAALLRRALRHHFRYPALAMQNSWEGHVVLRVRVAADGHVGDAHVLKGSGFRILDRAARRSANSIGRLPAARPLLAGQAMSFRVPVDYRLRP